jgi:hypothetical protein
MVTGSSPLHRGNIKLPLNLIQVAGVYMAPKTLNIYNPLWLKEKQFFEPTDIPHKMS